MRRYITNRIGKPTLKSRLKQNTTLSNKTMIEISAGVYIGSDIDYEINKNRSDMNFINACKHPYWVTYASNHDTNNMYGYEGNRLICNLVDATDIKYIPKEIIEECLKFIDASLKNNKKVLINCNEGRSRSASIGLIYLLKNNIIRGASFGEMINNYIELVPRYKPNIGMLEWVNRYYKEYRSGEKW